MRAKINFMMLFSALLLTMCTSLANKTTYSNGLTCQNYSDGANCSYACPDGSIQEMKISGSISPLYGASREELDAQLCWEALPPSPTVTLVPPSPSPTPTLVASPTVQATATVETSLTAQASTTAEIPATGLSLLTERVLMCDLGANLINFRMVQPPPDLTGRTLTAQIADTESMCYVNQTNPSLLTCTLPDGITFPARIVVSLDGSVIHDFTYGGLGCEILSTAVPTTTP